MVPIRQRPHSSSIVDVISQASWVAWIVYDHRAASSVDVLGSFVGMVPEGTSLIGNVEAVGEGSPRLDGALSSSCWSIGPRLAIVLEDSVPVLEKKKIKNLQGRQTVSMGVKQMFSQWWLGDQMRHY